MIRQPEILNAQHPSSNCLASCYQWLEVREEKYLIVHYCLIPGCVFPNLIHYWISYPDSFSQTLLQAYMQHKNDPYIFCND